MSAEAQSAAGGVQDDPAKVVGRDARAGDGHEGAKPTDAPHFVAPASYLRPLSRAQPPSAGGGSRPATRDSSRPMTPQDREQIEGLVSFALLCYAPLRHPTLLEKEM